METVILCATVFFGRVVDMSCGTMRTILTVKEKTALAALVGFFESFIWFVIVRQALNSGISGAAIAVSYGSGFAAGTYVGGKLAKWFISSNIVVQVVTTNKNDVLIHALRDAEFAVSVLNVNSSEFCGDKYMLLSEIGSKRLNEYKDIIYLHDPKAFILVQETKYVFNGFNVNRK
ncbi:MAG: DUF2179 domain-containing protein [Ruminococcaceae bacterium]|nr:DUF2179 domain-containing protein [Oscillospiraceae bacterium]